MPVTPPPIYGLIDSRPDHISSTIFAVDAGRRLRMKKTLKAGPALLLIASLGVHVDVVAQQIARVEAPMPKPAAIRKPGTLAKASSTLAERNSSPVTNFCKEARISLLSTRARRMTVKTYWKIFSNSASSTDLITDTSSRGGSHIRPSEKRWSFPGCAQSARHHHR